MNNLSPNVLTALLITLAQADDAVVVQQRMAIPLRRALASAWSAAKLRRCRALLAAGHTPPPIRVTRYQLHDEAWYVVGDGNHRTVAAQEAEHAHIDAIVGAQAVCRPEAYRVDVAQRTLYRRTDRGEYVQVASALAPEFVQALRQAGVAADATLDRLSASEPPARTPQSLDDIDR